MAVLSIAKLRPGAEAYQLSGVAEGLDAYYTGGGEAPGRWVGGGAAALGLEGEVDGASLRAVMAGLAPGCGGLTPNGTRPISSARRVPGFDLTFKAPKSVSVLYAVSDDPRVQGAIIDAGETALDAVVTWLEQEAIRVRRGSNNQPWKLAAEARGESTAHAEMRELPTGGLVGAAFRHRTSRAGDPFLHWHMLVANMAQGPDGRWSSIVHPELYRHGKAAGEVFQAVLRDELTRSLGVMWRPGRHVHEIAGVPDAIMATFSKRRAEIDAWLHATGLPDTAKGAETAALATRRSKTELEHERGLHERWRTEAIDAGWGPEQAAELIDTLATRATDRADVGGGVWRLVTPVFGPDGDVVEVERVVEPEEWIAKVLRRELTVSSTTFGRPDVARAVAARLGDGASLETIGRIVDRFMASTQVVPVGDNTTSTGTKRGQEYTSAEMASVESAFIATLDAAAARIDAGVVERVIASRATIGADQAEAVRLVCGTDRAVSVIIGPAGTGKTFTLDAVRDAYQTEGWTVIGVSPSAKGATELEAGSSIASSTMHSLQHRLLARSLVLGRRSLVVVDEAAMADIRILAWVTTRAVQAGAKVILVGDHRQLPEVGAGGGFAYAAAHSPAVAKLTRNRRQRAGWEIDALNHLRDGSIPKAVAHYHHHDRVVVQPDRAAMIHDAATRWMAATANGETCVLAVGTNDLARALNHAVLEQLIESGQLPDTPGLFAGQRYWPGQQVIVRTNYTAPDRTSVTNGQILTVTRIVDDTMTLIDTDGTAVELDGRFVDRGGRIDHGYAVTTYRTQGGTWDRSIAVGLDGLWREGAYTALSRGRHANLIIVAHPEWDTFEHDHRADLDRHDRGIRRVDEHPPTPAEAIEDQFTQRRGKHLAHTTDPDTAVVSELAQQPLPEIRAAARALRNETVAANTVGATWDTLQTRRRHLQRIAGGLTGGARVRVTDRHNLGTVLFLDPIEPIATVHFISPDGAETSRLIPYHQLDPLETQANIPQRVQHWANIHLTTLDERIDKWVSVVQRLGTQPGDHDRYRRAAQVHIQRHAQMLAAVSPAWLRAALGDRPTSPMAFSVWQDAVTAAAEYQAETTITDPQIGFGPRPTDPKLGAAWDEAWIRTEDARHWLANDLARSSKQIAPVASQQDLQQRLAELGHLFTTAPPDQRITISRLLAGQQSLDNVQIELKQMHAQQRNRQTWILEHWPHIVEAAEIERALSFESTTCQEDASHLQLSRE